MKKNCALLFVVLFYTIPFALFSQTADSYLKAALDAVKAEHYEEAIQNFDKAIQADPNKNYFYYQRGVFLKRLFFHNEAIKDLDKSIELKPTDEAYYQRAELKMERNEFKDAKQDLEKIKPKQINFDNLNLYLGIIAYNEKKYQDAIGYLNFYHQDYRNSVDCYYYLGLASLKLKQSDEAIKNFNQTLIFSKNNWHAFYGLYQAYLQQNNSEKALYNLSMVIELGERKIEYYQERARLYLINGNTELASQDKEIAKNIK